MQYWAVLIIYLTRLWGFNIDCQDEELSALDYNSDTER